MLHLRVIFGLIFGAVLLTVFYLDRAWSAGWPGQAGSIPPGTCCAILAIPMVIVAVREMANLLARENVVISRRTCTAAAILCMIWPWLQQVAEQRPRSTGDWTQGFVWLGKYVDTTKPGYVVPTVLAVGLVAVFAVHSRHRRVEGAMAAAGGSLLAIVYLGVLPGFFFPIVFTHGAWMLLGIIGIVKAADVGAYTTGHLVGRHKLIFWLSPGKTIEGFFGGLVFAGAIGVLVAYLHTDALGSRDIHLVAGAALGVALGAVGQLGDLLESLLKRDAGVKDSGKVPGFGGLLDLLDSPLLAAPAAYWLLKLVTHASVGLAAAGGQR